MAISGGFDPTLVRTSLQPSRGLEVSEQRQLLDPPKPSPEINLTPQSDPFKRTGGVAQQSQLVQERVPAIYARPKPQPKQHTSTGGVAPQEQLIAKRVPALYAETKNLPDPFEKVGGVQSQSQLIGKHIKMPGPLATVGYVDPAESVMLAFSVPKFNFDANREVIIGKVLGEERPVLSQPDFKASSNVTFDPGLPAPPPPPPIRDKSIDEAIQAAAEKVPLTDPSLDRPVIDPTPRVFGVYV